MDKLDLYNDALQLLGQRRLESLTEQTESRITLDGAYTRAGIEFCLEVVKPSFARKTVQLNGPSAGTTFAFNHPSPSDEIDIIALYKDRTLDQPIGRYIKEGGVISCDFNDIYLQYVSDDKVEDEDAWSPSFVRVVGAYLAKECVERLAPKRRRSVDKAWKDRVQAASVLSVDDPTLRPSAPATTITNDWLPIYNDALMILGLDEIVAPTDDSDRRQKLDRVLSAGLVGDILEDSGGWQFAQTTDRIDFDPSLQPEFGPEYAFNKPDDMHSIYGVWADEHLKVPIKEYIDEGDNLFCGYQVIYITYLTKDMLVNPAQWPDYFRRYVAGCMAYNAAPSLLKDANGVTITKEVDRVRGVYDTRRSSALSTDAMQSPPRRISEGNWVDSRYRGHYRGRP